MSDSAAVGGPTLRPEGGGVGRLPTGTTDTATSGAGPTGPPPETAGPGVPAEPGARAVGGPESAGSGAADRVAVEPRETGPEAGGSGPEPPEQAGGHPGPVMILDPEPTYLVADDDVPPPVPPPPPPPGLVAHTRPRRGGPRPAGADEGAAGDGDRIGDTAGEPPAAGRAPEPDTSRRPHRAVATGAVPGVPVPLVTAVVAGRSGQPHRDRMLSAVAAQTRQPDAVVLVDLVPAASRRRVRVAATDEGTAGGEATDRADATDRAEATGSADAADGAPGDAGAGSAPGDVGAGSAPGDSGIGSTEGIELLAGLPERHVLRLPPRTGLGDVVRAALVALESGRLTPAPDPRPEGIPGDGPGPAGGEPDGGPVAPDAPRDADREWLWLLPDDGVPDPDALGHLLEAVETAPSVGIAGCKQVSWEDDQQLIEVGFTTSRRGVRITGIDRYEVDQGQHDHRCDVLAVSSAGMLVRRDVWERTGGPDPGLAHARDDLDLCRRARLAGHRVVVVPAAVVARTGRPSGPGCAAVPVARTAVRGPWARADRYDTLYLRLAGAPLPLVPLALLWALPGALLRFLPLLLARRPRRAVEEIVAALLVLFRPHRWLRARRRAARRAVPRRMLRPLLATRREIWRQRRETLAERTGLPAPAAGRRGRGLRPVSPAAGSAGTRTGAGEPHDGPLPAGPGAGVSAPAGPDPGPVGRRARREVGDVVTMPADGPGQEDPLQIRAVGPRLTTGSRRSAVLAPLPVLLLTAIAGFAALRHLLGGSGAVAGPFLPPAPADSTELWRLVSSPLRPVGLGGRAVADPLVELVAALASVPGLSPRLVTAALLLGALPLSALSAWIAAGQATRVRALRVWAALAWAACPPLLVATGTGRPAAVLAHVMLPLAALALVRTVGGVRGGRHGHSGARRPQGSMAAASAAGVSLTVVIAAAPSLTVVAALAVLAVALVSPGRRLLLLVPTVVVGVLLAPWWLAVARQPRLLLADPGLGVLPHPTPRTPWWHLLLLPDTPGTLFGGAGGELARLTGGLLPPSAAGVLLAAAAGGSVLLLGLVGVLRRGPGRVAVALGWALALAGLATALVAERVAVAGTAGGPSYGFAGPGLSVLALGVALAAVVGVPGQSDRERRRGPARAAAVTPVLGVVGLVAVLAAWSWQGPWGGNRADPAPASGGGVASATVEEVPAVGLVRPDVLPAVAAADAQGPAATRTLVLQVTDSRVRWAVLGAAGPRLGEDSAALAASRLGPANAARDGDIVVPLVGELLSDSGHDLRGRLADLAIGSVLLLPPTDDGSTLALDSSPGLERVLTSRGATLWRVGLDGGNGRPTRPSMARIVDADGAALAALSTNGRTVRARVPAGAEGRLLVLSTRRDGAWTATVDGRRLTPRTHGGWAQAFALPAAGGSLVVGYHDVLTERLAPVREVVAGLALLVAIPLPRLRRRTPAPPRPSRPVPRGPDAEGSSPQPTRPRVFDEDYPGPDAGLPPGAGPALPLRVPADPSSTGPAVLDLTAVGPEPIGPVSVVPESVVPEPVAPGPVVPEPVDLTSVGPAPDPADGGTGPGTGPVGLGDPADPPGPGDGRSGAEPRAGHVHDVLGGAPPGGIVDWAAVHLPDPGSDSDSDSGSEPGSEPELRSEREVGTGSAAGPERVPERVPRRPPGAGTPSGRATDLRRAEDHAVADDHASADAAGPLAGEPVAGAPIVRAPVAGDLAVRAPVAGDPVARAPVAGDPVAGAPVAGDPAAVGRAGEDQAVDDRPVAGSGPRPGEGTDGRAGAPRAPTTLPADDAEEDEELVPTFPVVDPVELEDFEPYRPDPDRRFYGRRGGRS